MGAIGRSSPYRDYDGGVTQVIPAITYNGERLQILGPNVSFGLAGTGKLRLAAAGTYRPGVYDEDDSDYLSGMGDRDSTFMAGLALRSELPMGFDAALSYQHDVLDRIGGGEARISIDKSFQFRSFRLFSQKLASIGWRRISPIMILVCPGTRPQREGLPIVSIQFSLRDVGLGIQYEITTDWLLVANVAVEFFDDEITDSPIVDEDYVIKGFLAVNYVF